jgi:hypothetical protein
MHKFHEERIPLNKFAKNNSLRQNRVRRETDTKLKRIFNQNLSREDLFSWLSSVFAVKCILSSKTFSLLSSLDHHHRKEQTLINKTTRVRLLCKRNIAHPVASLEEEEAKTSIRRFLSRTRGSVVCNYFFATESMRDSSALLIHFACLSLLLHSVSALSSLSMWNSRWSLWPLFFRRRSSSTIRGMWKRRIIQITGRGK